MKIKQISEQDFKEYEYELPDFQYNFIQNIMNNIDDKLIYGSKDLLLKKDGKTLIFAIKDPNIKKSDYRIGKGLYRISIEPIE